MKVTMKNLKVIKRMNKKAHKITQQVDSKPEALVLVENEDNKQFNERPPPMRQLKQTHKHNLKEQKPKLLDKMNWLRKRPRKKKKRFNKLFNKKDKILLSQEEM